MQNTAFSVLGVTINTNTMNEVVAFVTENIRNSQEGQAIFTPNPEILLNAEGDNDFRVVLNRATVNIPDGTGVLWAGELLQQPVTHVPVLREILTVFHTIFISLNTLLGLQDFTVFPERVTGVDLFENLLRKGQEEHWSFFLLGGGEGVAERARDAIVRQYNVKVVGAESGGMVSPEGVGEKDHEIRERIRETRPDVLLVSFGAPKQERWIDNNRDLPFKIALGAGATLDFWAGVQQRAPQAVQQLEWLWRFIHDPSRIGRIMRAIVVFPLRVVVSKFRMIE